MPELDQREYRTVILGVMLHVARSRLVGDVGMKGLGIDL